MVRLVLIVLAAFLFLVLTLPVRLAEWIIRKIRPEIKFDRANLSMVQWIFGVFVWISGANVTVIGAERIPKDQAVLYIINHQSYFDVFLTYMRVPGLTGYVAKKEFQKVPLLRWWMEQLYCLFLDRENIREGLKTILQAIDYVKSGISMVIFPEGTRNRTGNECELLPFHEGSFKIAQKTGCLIVPVCISNSSALWEKQFPRVKKASVIIEYCEPICLDKLEKDQKKFIGKTVQSLMQDTLAKNRAALTAAGTVLSRH